MRLAKSAFSSGEAALNASAASSSDLKPSFLRASAPNLDNLGEHLIYRYTEALACNTLLVAPIITGSQRFIKNKVHYYGYKNIDEAVEIIKVLSSRPDVISTTSKNGHNRIKELVNTGVYWIQLEVLLKEKSVLK